MKKKKKKVNNQQRTALAGWEDEGGAAFDAAHDSSPRGEHRYPDSQQTEAEQKARLDRDDLKRKLAGQR